GFTVYPNPSSGNFIVRFSKISELPLEFSLYDMPGKLIQSKILHQNISANSEQIILNDLKQGIYFLEIKQGDKVAYSKVTIQ
ncbi:MAG: T9SS type A sorting domain-containing protein, partial [Bacteroidota bacterium]